MNENNTLYNEFRWTKNNFFWFFEIRYIKPNLTWQLIFLKKKVYLNFENSFLWLTFVV